MQKTRNSPASSAGIYLYLRQKSPYTCVKIRKKEKTEVINMNGVAEKAIVAEDMNWEVVKHEIESGQKTVMELAPDEESAKKIACKLSKDEEDVYYTVEAL